MIVLYTDFGIGSPYMGQMKATLHREQPHLPIIDLHADLACFRPEPAAYLLAAYVEEFPPGSVFLCVVDPGVGSASRKPVAMECRGRWFVGPDNGLFDVLALQHPGTRVWEITWRPPRLSHTFHGRDLFAPMAARLSRGDTSGLAPLPGWAAPARPADCWEVIYVDHFGNLFTGVRAAGLEGSERPRLALNGQALAWADTYGDVPPGTALCYANSIGLLEIGVNQGHAASRLGAAIGTPVQRLA